MIPFGEGTDHLAYQAGDLIMRFAKDADPARLRQEADLLAIVASYCPFPVPRASFEGDHLSYPKLPGVALIDAHGCHSPGLARRLAGMLLTIQAIPAAEVSGLVEHDDYSPADWLQEAARHHASVAAETAAYRAPIEAFLASGPPDEATSFVFSHNDFGTEHVLVDPQSCAVTGVIDWSDAAITDPAADFGRLYRDLGPVALHATPLALCERAVFYARCGALEDLVHGLAHHESRYVTKSLASLRWLFG